MTLFEWEIEQYPELAAARKNKTSIHAIFRTLDKKSELQVSVLSDLLLFTVRREDSRCPIGEITEKNQGLMLARLNQLSGYSVSEIMCMIRELPSKSAADFFIKLYDTNISLIMKGRPS